jgi:probable rRNA maturation factor
VTSPLPSDRTLHVEIQTSDEAWNRLLPEPQPWALRILRETLTRAGAKPRAPSVTLSLLFADDSEIRALNARFRGADKPTNVLSFPAHPALGKMNADEETLGDIAFALETIRAEAAASGKPVLDHLSHLLAYGILHLIGFTHDEDEDAARMMALEIAVLGALGIADPYAVPQAGAA